MIRPQIANPVLMSILFATLAGGAMLVNMGAPALSHPAAAALRKCDLGVVMGFLR